MLGAIIGDIVGSVYEFNNIHTTNFPFFARGAKFTDDSVMTVAVADWLLSGNHSNSVLVNKMVDYGHRYPGAGYGGMFYRWLFNPSVFPEGKRIPYNSFGNGSAMRASAVGWLFDTLEETEEMAKCSADVTHNHIEGIKGAQATAGAIFLARNGASKDEIRRYMIDKYGYDLSRTCDDVRPDYYFNETCQGTVPEAVIAFLDSNDYESAIRLGVSLGGDSDTLACITGGIAEAYYKNIPQWIVEYAWRLLPVDFKKVLIRFSENCNYIIDFKALPFHVDSDIPEKYRNRITSGHISSLKYNEVFVFGSNLQGHHGGGAARIAYDKFGAEWGVGVGITGNTYAIPTMHGGVDAIKPYVDDFVKYAESHPDKKFLVTRVGCGIAGFSDFEIAPLFFGCVSLENVSLPYSFWKEFLGKQKKYNKMLH